MIDGRYRLRGVAVLSLLLLGSRMSSAQASIGSSAVASPARPTPSINDLENDLLSPSLSVRTEALQALSQRAREIDQIGKARLIELLRQEIDGEGPVVSAEEAGEEGYGEYMMILTQLVSRFNDPRVPPLLARQGIAFTSGSRFQVAMAGDAAIPSLVATWNANPDMRHAVVLTMALARFYADSTGSPLSNDSRSTIDAYVLRAAVAPEPWIRQAFVDATEVLKDVTYLPLISEIASNDSATIDGRRYVAQSADLLIPGLQAKRDASDRSTILSALAARHRATCHTGWISKDGICSSLGAKLAAAQDASARSQWQVERNTINAYLAELTAQRGKAVSETAYILLSGTADYLITRSQ